MKRKPFFFVSSLFCLALPAMVWAFGLNKVQYDRLFWSFYQTEHFDIYYPQHGDTVAYFAARHLEEMYADISDVTGHELTMRIPIILHNSHTEFEQTNVIRFPLHESIGGFTEIFKNRIVLPFEGNYADFYHVLKHELVHAVVNNMLMSDKAGGLGRQNAPRFPLWVNEGLAEYISLGWDLSSEFYMIDATTSGYVSPPAMGFNGFLAYKGGQLFYHFMESVYGEGTIKKFIQELKHSRQVENAFKKITHTSLEEAGEIWLRELRHVYWPELGRRQYGKSVARRLTHHGKDLSFFNMQPAISPDKKEIAFFSDKESREGVFIINLETEKITRSVIQGGTKGKHESFHFFKSGLAWGPGSKRLAIVSKGGGKDVIHIINATTGDIIEEIAPPVQAILSPNWSRDGRYICFSGINEGYADIYQWDRDTKSLLRLTNDPAYDGKPSYSPSGNWISFESNRTTDGSAYTNCLNIYKIKSDGTQLLQITKGSFENKSPCYGPSDSLIVFVSNRSGIDNLYLSVDSAVVEPSSDSADGTPGLKRYQAFALTNILAGSFTPSWSTDGSLLAFTVFEMGGWDIYLMKSPFDKMRTEPLPKTHFVKVSEDTTKRFFRPVNWENLSSYKKDTVDSDTATVAADSISLESPDSSLIADTEEADTLLKSNSTKDLQAKTDFLDEKEYLDENGVYKKHTYEPKFTLDAASAALGVSNFDGPLGGGMIVLSDLMGDQEVQISLFLNGDIKNSQVEVYYNYLPYRIDYMIGGFYRAFDNSAYYSLGGKELSFGAQSSLIYPLSVFTRWQLNVNAMYMSRETMDGTRRKNSSGIFSPNLYWSHDNTQWGMVGPVNGQRINLRATLVPPVFKDDMFFCVGDIDLRKYWRYFKKYTLAVRFSGGFSEAIGDNRNPHQFWLGGDNFLNIYPLLPNRSNIPDDIDLEGLYFSEFALPLRGYRFFEFAGNRKILSNIELRFPLIHELILAFPPPGIRFPPVMGMIFCDYGAAWTRGRDFEKNQGLAIGYGMRINLGIFVLRWTRAWPLEAVGNHEKVQTDYWSLGAEF
ncbi:MAG: PD40 domain-containing protein [Fibrobacteria bacterium]|nr:PD40 domain-containing protein [Fibrobacteria bacterium]